MRQGIIFTICFFVTFNLAFISGFKSVHREPESAPTEGEMVRSIEAGKKVPPADNKIFARSGDSAQEDAAQTQEAIVPQRVVINQGRTATVPDQAQEPEDNTDSIGKMETSLSGEGTPAIYKTVAGYRNFYKNWEKPKQVLGELTNIIKRYAETEGLEASSRQLFADMNAYSRELNEEVKDLAENPVNADSYDAEQAHARTSLTDKQFFFSPFAARDMYMNLLHAYYGALKDQNVFLNSVNEERTPDPGADNFIIDGNKVLAQDENYQKLKNIIEEIRKIYPQINGEKQSAAGSL